MHEKKRVGGVGRKAREKEKESERAALFQLCDFKVKN